MRDPNGNNVREHVMREMRMEIRSMAGEGMSAGEIALSVNGHRDLTNAEQSLIELLTCDAVAQAKGHY